MLAFPFDADQLAHRVFLTRPAPTGHDLEELLDACAAYDRGTERVTVVSTGPWPDGRWMIKAFGPEFVELGNVYARKGAAGRARLLVRKLRELRAADVRWFGSPLLDWRLARAIPGWRREVAKADAPRAEAKVVADGRRIAMLLKSDLAGHAAHVNQALNTAASLVRAGAEVRIAAPVSEGTFDDVLGRVAVDVPRDRLSHEPLRAARRSTSYVDHLGETMSKLAGDGFGTLYFRQVRVASMVLPHARRLGMRVFLEAHHPYSTWAIYQRRKLWRGTPAEPRALPYYRRLMRCDREYERRVYRECDGILCTTDAMMRHVERVSSGTARTLLLRNGAPEPSEPECDLADRGAELIYTGKTSTSKGTDVLIDSLAHLTDATLVVVGGPTEEDLAPYRRRATDLGVADRVTFRPWESQARLFERVRRARVTVHPIAGRGSKEWRVFTCPLKLMESMALGTPVVATDLPAIRELIEPGVTGVLVEPGDPAALAEGIRRLLDDATLAAAVADEARRRVATWSQSSRAERLLEFLVPAPANASA